MRFLIALFVIALAGGIAAADDPAPPTTLVGRVTDVLGKPINDARVYVMPRGGGRLQTVTDKDGRYTIGLADGGAYSVVIAVGRVHTYRQVLVADHALTLLDVEVETDITGGEVIRIVDQKLPAPAVPPKPSSEHAQKSLPYSPQAMERDAWARAFLLLDIDETGHVTRLKLLKRPGFDLDQIAIDEAFKLQFEPALDAAGKPIRTYIVWNMEWPSWGWLVQGNGTAAGRPVDYDGMYKYGRLNPEIPAQNSPLATFGLSSGFAAPLPIQVTTPLSRVPCAGSGPLNLDSQNRAYRDCSTPDMSNVDALPWITRANAKQALADLDANAPQIVPGPRRSKVPGWIAFGVTTAFAAGLVYSYVQYDKYANFQYDAFKPSESLIHEHQDVKAKLDAWNHHMLEFAGAMVVSSAVTAFLWGRGQTRESFSVQPTRGGGAVSFGRSF